VRCGQPRQGTGIDAAEGESASNAYRMQTVFMTSAYRSPAGAAQVRDWCRAALARWAVPHQTHSVNTSLGETHVVSLGAGTDVCVYLPGTNFNASSSTVVLGALAARFRVYAADLPGQPGLSAPNRPGDELSGYAGWVTELIEWVRRRDGGAQILLVGHSRGAAVALSADPDAVNGLCLFSPAGLIHVRPTIAMLRSTVPWLVRRNNAGARRLLDYMSGPGRAPAADLVDWMTMVARTCRSTGAPAPLPDADVARWKGHNVRVAVGDHDVFFPFDKLSEACRAMLNQDPLVVPSAGHLLVDEEPALAAEMVAGLT
jgi:pimeloyl-ACP methyl ester carboxylesterase